ncbi:MAG: glycosyltransferase family 2 protein [Ornithinibacter sp.]
MIVPAHDEEACIGQTLDSLKRQTDPPDRIIVVADNCSDRTADIALDHGVGLVATVGNTHRKAGALNQALSQVLGRLRDTDRVLLMDADSVICDEWLTAAGNAFDRHPGAGAVCASYRGREDSTMLGLLQRIEFAREGRRIARRQARVDVLTGIATLFEASVLRAVADARGTVLPGERGDVFLSDSITEDFEITLAVKTLGYNPIGPKDARAITEVMPTLKALRRQRVRWQRGTLESLLAYGLTPVTRRYWLVQMMTYGLSLSTPVMLALLAATGWLYGTYYDPRWLLIVPFFFVEQLVFGWRSGWKARLFLASMLPLYCYDHFRSWVYWLSFVKAVARQEKRWD